MEQPAPLMQRLFECEKPSGVRISPAAQSPRQVVYQCAPYGRKGEHTKSSLWLAEHGVQHSARQITSGLFNDHSPCWTPDGKSIIFISDRAKPGKSSALYCLTLAAGEPYPLTPAENEKTIERFDIDPCAGSFVAYLSPDEDSPERKQKIEDKDDADVYGQECPFNRLRLVHIVSRTVETLFAQDSHVTRLVWSKDSTAVIFMSHDTLDVDDPTRQFSLVTLSSRAVTTICRYPGYIFSDLVRSPKGALFLAGVIPGVITSSNCLYELDVEAKTCIPHSNPELSCAVSISSSASATSVMYAIDEKTVQTVFPSSYSRPDEGTGMTLQKVASNHISSIDWVLTKDENDRAQYLGVVTSSYPDRSTEVVSYSQHSEQPSGLSVFVYLSQHAASLATTLPFGFVGVQAPGPDSTDGPRGFLLAPKGLSGIKKAPCFVDIHGGPYWRSTPGFDPTGLGWTTVLRDAGYAVLFVNYSGSSGRGEAWAQRASAGVGTVDYEDVLAVVEAAIEMGAIDPERIVVGGWSQGGFLSYLCATRNASGLRFKRPLDSSTTTSTREARPSWRFKGAVCGAGVTDWDAMAMTSDAPRFEGQLSGSLPWALDKADTSGRAGSAIWEMAQARTEDIPPVLILHGKEDQRVPWTQGLAYSRACRAKGVPCEFVTYPREGHDFEERAHLVDMARRVLSFVQRTIG